MQPVAISHRCGPLLLPTNRRYRTLMIVTGDGEVDGYFIDHELHVLIDHIRYLSVD